MQNVIGVIGGSGLYKLDIISNLKEEKIETPYGKPSANLMVGDYEGTKIVFLPRHGIGHTISPSEINYRANIYALKMMGVRWILAVSAVGSMKLEIKPGDMVVVDQYIDRTNLGRASSFFGDGVVGHVAFGDPVCNIMNDAIAKACAAAKVTYHNGGTYLCMEGPQFSTRAESNMYRSWGVSVIGMTNIPEAKLAREAEICYGALAMATDYDCWHETEEDVTADAVVQTLLKNVETSKKVFKEFLKRIPTQECPHQSCLKHAIVTDRALIPEATKKRNQAIYGKYL